jgi:hypothetical protein
MTKTEQSVLEELDRILRLEDVRVQIGQVVERVRADLHNQPDAVMAWEPIPLTTFGDALPEGIRSSWVFILRAGTNTGPERHPNSHQRMMTFEGIGDMQIGELGRLRSNVLTSDANAPVEQRWISIPQNVWHQPVIPSGADWVVVSFHTVPAEELIEERPDAGATGETKQKRYLAKAETPKN